MLISLRNYLENTEHGFSAIPILVYCERKLVTTPKTNLQGLNNDETKEELDKIREIEKKCRQREINLRNG